MNIITNDLELIALLSVSLALEFLALSTLSLGVGLTWHFITQKYNIEGAYPKAAPLGSPATLSLPFYLIGIPAAIVILLFARVARLVYEGVKE